MRVRVRFTKVGKVRFIGHRDVARVWERALRLAGVPVAYSAGFSPRPRVSFGLALSTGYESDGEYLDVEVDPARADAGLLDGLAARLSGYLPVGMEVTGVGEVGAGEGSLQESVVACTWALEVDGVTEAEARAVVAGALAAPALMATRTRKGTESDDDIRPAIVALEVVGPGGAGGGAGCATTAVALRAELATQPRGLRPGELVAALFGPDRDHRARRVAQWLERGGTRDEPLAAAPGAAAPLPPPAAASA